MAKATKTKPAKYTDKSSGQPELQKIIIRLKPINLDIMNCTSKRKLNTSEENMLKLVLQAF